MKREKLYNWNNECISALAWQMCCYLILVKHVWCVWRWQCILLLPFELDGDSFEWSSIWNMECCTRFCRTHWHRIIWMVLLKCCLYIAMGQMPSLILVLFIKICERVLKSWMLARVHQTRFFCMYVRAHARTEACWHRP